MTSASAGPRPTDSERMKTGEKPQTAMVNSMARRATGGPARTDKLQDCGDLGGGLDHALLGEELLQLARLEHLGDDIAAADELASTNSCGMVGQLEYSLMPWRSASDSRTLMPL